MRARAFLVQALSLGLAASAAAQGDADAAKRALGAAGEQRAPVTETTDAMRLFTPGFHLGGYFWSDTGALDRTNAAPGQYNQVANYMGGRLVAAASFYKEMKGWFGAGKVEFAGLASELAKGQYEAHTQDAYLMLGQRAWDLQVGRFLAWEVYHRGQGMELWTPDEAGPLNAAPMYWLNTTRGYRNEVGQIAVHGYVLPFLGLELGGIYGQETTQNELGLRPVADFQFQGLRVIGGYEYFAQRPQTEADKVKATTRGYAGRIEYAVPLGAQSFGLGRVFPRPEDPLNRPNPDAITFGVDAAHSSVDAFDINGLVDGAKTYVNTTFGGYLDIDFWDNAIGFGYHRVNAKTRAGAHNDVDLLFVSYLYRLPVENLFVKAVYGLGQARIEDVDANKTFTNKMNSFRLRLAYDFR